MSTGYTVRLGLRETRIAIENMRNIQTERFECQAKDLSVARRRRGADWVRGHRNPGDILYQRICYETGPGKTVWVADCKSELVGDAVQSGRCTVPTGLPACRSADGNSGFAGKVPEIARDSPKRYGAWMQWTLRTRVVRMDVLRAPMD